LSTCPTPVIVPPVPMPATNAATWPSVSFQTSSAVVRRWISGFASDEDRAVLLAELLGLGHRALHALAARREHQLRAVGAQQPATLLAHRLRHREDDAVAAGGAHEGEGDPGVAARRLDDRPARLQLPRRLGRVDHRDADAVLHAARRVVELQLGGHRGARALGEPVQAHQRCVADQLGNVVVDPHCRRSPLAWEKSSRLIGLPD
jgi:hypothetical protein